MPESYRGVIIEESLLDKSVLKKVKIISTRVENVIERHKTPWLKQWTLHTIEVLEKDHLNIASEISNALDCTHTNWYADYKTKDRHIIIFSNKIFDIDRKNKAQYDEAKKYGVLLGIPPYQVNFSPEIK